MAISKIVLNGTEQMDVTDTTAEAADVASGKYFYAANGVRTLGQGNGGGALIVGAEVVIGDGQTTVTLNKTWQEIYDAMTQGIVPVIVLETEGVENVETVVLAYTYEDLDIVYSINSGTGTEYTTDQANGYPSRSF